MDLRHYERLYGMRSRLIAGAIAGSLLGIVLVFPGPSARLTPANPPVTTAAALIAESPVIPTESAAPPDLATREETPVATPANQSYVVQPGDCVWNIAESFCGSGFRWREVYEANREKIVNPELIYPEQEFDLACRQ